MTVKSAFIEGGKKKKITYYLFPAGRKVENLIIIEL